MKVSEGRGNEDKLEWEGVWSIVGGEWVGVRGNRGK